MISDNQPLPQEPVINVVSFTTIVRGALNTKSSDLGSGIEPLAGVVVVPTWEATGETTAATQNGIQLKTDMNFQVLARLQLDIKQI